MALVSHEKEAYSTIGFLQELVTRTTHPNINTWGFVKNRKNRGEKISRTAKLGVCSIGI